MRWPGSTAGFCPGSVTTEAAIWFGCRLRGGVVDAGAVLRSVWGVDGAWHRRTIAHEFRRSGQLEHKRWGVFAAKLQRQLVARSERPNVRERRPDGRERSMSAPEHWLLARAIPLESLDRVGGPKRSVPMWLRLQVKGEPRLISCAVGGPAGRGCGRAPATPSGAQFPSVSAHPPSSRGNVGGCG